MNEERLLQALAAHAEAVIRAAAGQFDSAWHAQAQIVELVDEARIAAINRAEMER
jgi:hypothetical protein